jgi:hypothetical protein
VRRSSSERSLQNINDLIRATLALRTYEFRTANIKLVEQYHEDLPPVWVSPEEVQQVLLNLILNAEHVMRTARSGGTLTLRTDLVDGTVVADVWDDGPGVPATLKGRIFEPFFSTKGVGEGTGLGLSIALGIAEAHGGMLSIVPTASGACFRLALPASHPTDQAEQGGADVSTAARQCSWPKTSRAAGDAQRLLQQRGLSVDLAVNRRHSLTKPPASVLAISVAQMAERAASPNVRSPRARVCWCRAIASTPIAGLRRPGARAGPPEAVLGEQVDETRPSARHASA